VTASALDLAGPGVTPPPHPVAMRFTNLLPRSAAPERSAAPACPQCSTDHHHCHATLVLHADGSVHCDDADQCEGREDLHEWWVSCIDLGCGCTGDEHPQPMLLAA